MPSIVNGTVADGRTAAAQTFSPLVRETENDLGGHENLSAIEWSLVEAYVGATVAIQGHYGNPSRWPADRHLRSGASHQFEEGEIGTSTPAAVQTSRSTMFKAE
jgi:hypothetical protein